jgi:hypothetical protein
LTIRRPRLHPGQRQVKAEAARFNVVDAGRRWGKNVLLRDVLIEPALDGKPAAWLAPTYKMLQEDWRELKYLLAPAIAEKWETEHRIQLITGGVIDMWSLDNADAVRGRKYQRVTVNEAAQVANLQEAWERVIRPTLTDYAGDAWFGSTPRGRNYYWQLWMRGQREEGWKSWQFPTSTNPFIQPKEIEAAQAELPQLAFRQEYLADFLEGEGSVFRNVRACLTAPKGGEHRGHKIVAGLDWGRMVDSTSLSVGCATCRVELFLDRYTRVEYAFQRDRIKSAVDRWHAQLLAESNSIGQPNIEALRNDGVSVRPFETTATTKPPLIQSLALAFERQEWKWLPDELAALELEAYEMKTNPVTGRPSYSAPEGGHDDTVMARALMLWQATHSGVLVAFVGADDDE